MPHRDQQASSDAALNIKAFHFASLTNIVLFHHRMDEVKDEVRDEVEVNGIESMDEVTE